MLGTAIYLNSERLELFKDETVELNSSVQNINDISKTFTDYSQSFTVPASDDNNKISPLLMLSVYVASKTEALY